MKKINPYQKKRPDGTRFPGWYARIPLASGKERRVSLGTKEEHTARSILNDIALLYYRKAQDIQEAPQGLEPTAYTLYFETDTAVYFSQAADDSIERILKKAKLSLDDWIKLRSELSDLQHWKEKAFSLQQELNEAKQQIALYEETAIGKALAARRSCPTIEEARKAFSLRMHSETSARNAQDIVRTCNSFFESIEDSIEYPFEVTTEHIRNYLIESSAGSTQPDMSFNRRRTQLHRFFAMAEEEWSITNLIRSIKRRTEQQRDDILIWHKEEEVISAVKEMPDYWRTLILFCLYTGVRGRELWGLRKLDVTSDFVHITPYGDHKLKNPNSKRSVPVSANLAAVLSEYESPAPESELFFPAFNGTMWNFSTFAKNAYGKKGYEERGIKAVPRTFPEGIYIKSLRRSFGSICILSGHSFDEVAALMGHSDTKTTRAHYARLKPEYIKPKW